MPTAKKRINLTVDDDVFAALEKLSKQRAQSVSHISHSLIEFALELQEDLHFARVADARLEGKQARVSHERAWRR